MMDDVDCVSPVVGERNFAPPVTVIAPTPKHVSYAAAWIDPPTMVHSRHTTKVFDADLEELARAIAEMGGLAERQIAETIGALTTRDSRPAQRIVAADAT